MEVKIGLFDISDGLLICVLLGSRIKNPGIYKPGKDSIDVVIKFMFPFDGCADLVETEIIVDILKKEISRIKGAQLIQRDRPYRREGDRDGSILFLSLLI
jgi:hypothetical protein